eukprot:TCALIF_00787-PA protein Name:"Similar to ZNF652 Zinc finger protein 652 (Homo sapiens)" AED:0.34 eAED:0.34 QI:0/0/0/0.33/1/1/3/0/593
MAAWQDKHCSDVTIVGRDGVEVRAHRIVLATTSPMLAQAFHLDVLTHSHEDSYILCPDLSSHDLLALLAPMYQGGAHPVVQDDAMTALGIEPSGSQVATEPLSLTPEDRHSLTMADPITSPEPEREEVASPWLKSRYRFTGSTALCRICEKEYQYRGSKSDGILIRHSKRQHPEVDEESEERQGECNDRLYRPDREREEDRHGSSVEAVAGKPETNSESDFVRHYFDIHGTKASCKHCSSRPISIASGSKALRHHIANKHPHLLSDTGAVQYLVLSDQLIQCQTCGQELEVLAADRDQVLQNHQKECLSASQPVGKENESDPSRILLSSYFLPYAPSEQSLTCSACLKEFETTDNIYQKLERHLCCAHTDLYDEYVRKRDKLTSIENQAVAQIFDKVSGFFRLKSDSNLVQACQECDQAIKLKSSDDIRSLVIHFKRRHQDLLTEWLAESTSSLAELDKALSHRKRQIRKRPTANDDPLNRTCQHCSKVFSRTINLQLHVAAVHSGNRPFKCDTCDATFTRKETYMRHGHVNNRPFLCSVCELESPSGCVCSLKLLNKWSQLGVNTTRFLTWPNTVISPTSRGLVVVLMDTRS